MTVGELRQLLLRIQELYAKAGAKGPANDLKAFSEVLQPYSAKGVDAFCADVTRRLREAAEKPKGRRKAAAPTKGTALDSGLVGRHVTTLREAGMDRHAFDTALDRLKGDKTVKAPEAAEIARQYASTVTKYKSVSAAHADIAKAFVRRVRFVNKLS